MARSFYPGDLIVASGAGSPAVVTLAPAAAFTVWAAKTGGSQYTDLLASDGVTALPTSGGNPFCDSNGIRPDLYGPNNVNTVIWCAVGLGSTRYPMYPSTDIATALTTGAKLNVVQSFTAAQSFTSGTATTFSTTPTVSGNTVAHAGNLGTLMATSAIMGAFLNASGQYYIISVDPTTGLWPASGARNVPTGYTGVVIWDSLAFAGALKPTGMADNDRWRERIP
jgi:hypothetical protein